MVTSNEIYALGSLDLMKTKEISKNSLDKIKEYCENVYQKYSRQGVSHIFTDEEINNAVFQHCLSILKNCYGKNNQTLSFEDCSKNITKFCEYSGVELTTAQTSEILEILKSWNQSFSEFTDDELEKFYEYFDTDLSFLTYEHYNLIDEMLRRELLKGNFDAEKVQELMDKYNTIDKSVRPVI